MTERADLLRLTRMQLLELWRLTHLIEPVRADEAQVGRTDSADIDRLLLNAADARYDELLRTLPAMSLPLTDIAADVALERMNTGVCRVNLPAGCRRVVEVMAEGWSRPALITGPDTALAADQSCEFTRGGSEMPVAVTDGITLMLYTPPGDEPRLLSLVAVMSTAPEMYELTPAMLPLMDFEKYLI